MPRDIAKRRPSPKTSAARAPKTATKTRAASPAQLIDRVRKAALALPGTAEKLSHGEPAFFRGRMFITVDNNHHGSGHVAIWCRADLEAQRALVEASPRHFFVPPYVGGAGWLGVRLDSGLAWPVIAGCIESAWRAAEAKAARTR
jgi:hypothetical protein